MKVDHPPSPTARAPIPRVGMLATVRNRRGMVAAVEPFDAGPEGRLHLTTVEYLDADGQALEDHLVWEREPGARLLEPTSPPDVLGAGPMLPREFDALVRATRWSAVTPFIDPDGEAGPLDRLPFSAPFHAAIQVEDFQLVPLLKALRMPRVSLLLADDVGLGKTIEAGLILTELLIRRRIRRVLIICPASLRQQWKSEMLEKFSLPFDVVDRAETHALQRQLGLDANPWRTYGRVITSYHYLKQADVFESFRAASRMQDDSPHLPWDLLIVDEAHNLSPAAYGEDSDLAAMLRHLAPYFEHKLFLTATPHNGHTRSFTGLLQSLDPVRFTQTGELTPNERARIQDVLVRRLKRDVNAHTHPARFGDRKVQAIALDLDPKEQMLSAAFQEFRKKVRSLVSARGKSQRLAGAFAVEVLGKRLLSCPVAFAQSWDRYMEGLTQEEQASEAEIRAAEKAYREETGDDRENEGRTAHAARMVGAWLSPLAAELDDEIADLDRALERLDLRPNSGKATSTRQTTQWSPAADSRFDALVKWIDERLRTTAGEWSADERLVIFTEYKTTLDYLERRLGERFSRAAAGAAAPAAAPAPETAGTAAGRIRVLFGGMTDPEREEIKAAFNDPADPVRILVATDAASEGLNLQETARFLLHWDIPWNPARLEQRNGRLDRHGQARDVFVYHFATKDDVDLRFLGYVLGKVNDIREDLGSAGEVFDAAFQRRFIEDEDEHQVRNELEAALDQVKGRAAVEGDARIDLGTEEAAKMLALAAELDLEPGCLKATLEVALGMGGGGVTGRLDGPDADGRYRLAPPFPPQWADLIDDTLRLGGDGTGGGPKGALRKLLFDPQGFVDDVGGRPVFRPRRDTVLLHVGHPLFRRALATFARVRFPGSEHEASRWTVRRGWVPEGTDALLLLTLEELAVNELRETFHHWVRTVTLPIAGGSLGSRLPHLPAQDLRMPGEVARDGVVMARDLWIDVEPEVAAFLKEEAARLTEQLRAAVAAEYETERGREDERYRSRQGEVSRLIQEQTFARLEREIAQLRQDQLRGTLFDNEERLADLERSAKEKQEEIDRRRRHLDELQHQLRTERDRVLTHILPKRYALRGEAQVFPIAVELWLPEGAA